MATVQQQVHSADNVICQNIARTASDRGLLSQNLLSQLRNLVEGLIVWAHVRDPHAEFAYDQVGPALETVKATAKFRLLSRFHGLLQASASHYTLDADPSERLMLKYYEYLIRTRDLARAEMGATILANLEQFPVDLDPSLREYHDKIAARITATRSLPVGPRRDRFYIHSSRPFFVGGRIYYEVTFSPAHDWTSKFDRSIAFTEIDVTTKYAAYLDLAYESISVLGQTMPILVIRAWEVSIRPCEFNNYDRFFGRVSRARSSHSEYQKLMQYLTTMRASLLDLIDMTEEHYAQVRSWAVVGTRQQPQIFPMLDDARQHIQNNRAGSRVLRYLLLQMRNQVVKAQYDPAPNRWMSGLCLTSQSSPFDTMPFCTSPRGHNPRFSDLAEALDASDRRHELLARRVRTNVEQHGTIYTPIDELQGLGDIDELIARHNRMLPPTERHRPRRLENANGHVFIAGYEDDTVEILEQLQNFAEEGVEGHADEVERWLESNPTAIDDPSKAQALKALFARSKVALVYGAAGTGKSTLVNHVAQYFSEESKLFLAHTNPAVDNLRRRVDAPNSAFSTISGHVSRSRDFGATYDVLIIDECSTVDNASLLRVLECTTFDVLLLVGDVYQIESIQFGNWFSLARSYIPKESVFELTRPFRTNNDALLTLWNRVRNLDDKIEESLSKNGYSAVLGSALFEQQSQDEIVLCLNYDGLYGINNVNRFLQASNPSPPVVWGESTYKVGDPVLFLGSERFKPVVFNNMKGTICQIQTDPGSITFSVDIHRQVTPGELLGTELRWAGNTIVQFDVFERGNSDEDDDTYNTLVPFQIAYAVSIHKAQGLEYESVKVVITDANEERISHSIFYTAITRSRRQLAIFWTPETQQRILSRLAARESSKDEILLKSRRGVEPLGVRQKKAASRRPV